MERKDFEIWLDDFLGEYESHLINLDYLKGAVCYSKPLFSDNTILMVIRTPYILNYLTSSCVNYKDKLLSFFLYDKQTDIVIGEVSEIDFSDDWQDELMEHIYLVEERLEKSYCPECNSFLVQRENGYCHRFMGCSGFPECDFSSEIEDIYE